MRTLLSFFLLLVAVCAPVGPVHCVLPAAPVQAQFKTDDGPYVLWENGMAFVHRIKGGAHVVETFNAPFNLSLPGLASGRLRLDGRPYPEVDCELPEPPKIFAISDVHGVYDVMRNLLIANKVIDARNRWTFGKGHLVMLGDVADRGDQVTEAYWFIRALEESAKKAGGAVHMIIGNHELMLLTGDYRYVNPVYMNLADGMPTLAQLYGTPSEIGRWLRSRPIMMKLGDTLFVHGGVSPELLDRGLDIASVNRERRLTPRAERDEVNAFLLGSSGPLWYRGFVLHDREDSITETDLDRILARFKVKRIAVGHTTMDNVTALHDGKVLAVDAGIQHRRSEGLYIENGKIYRASGDGSKVALIEQRNNNIISNFALKGGAMTVATLAGGCFWGMEELFRQQPGVLDVEVGYTGGTVLKPTYEQVKTGRTGHAEAIKITFDPSKTTFEALLRFFFRMHDPTTLNRQGEDRGTQYRSVIFAHDESQREAADKVIREENASGFWPKPIVTEIASAGQWWRAEEYHQDYLQKNPGGYTCHWVRGQ